MLYTHVSRIVPFFQLPVAAKNPVKFGPEPLDCSAALMVAMVCSELDCNAAQCFESMIKQHPFAFGVDRPTLSAERRPSSANLNSFV